MSLFALQTHNRTTRCGQNLDAPLMLNLSADFHQVERGLITGNKLFHASWHIKAEWSGSYHVAAQHESLDNTTSETTHGTSHSYLPCRAACRSERGRTQMTVVAELPVKKANLPRRCRVLEVPAGGFTLTGPRIAAQAVRPEGEIVEAKLC